MKKLLLLLFCIALFYQNIHAQIIDTLHIDENTLKSPLPIPLGVLGQKKYYILDVSDVRTSIFLSGENILKKYLEDSTTIYQLIDLYDQKDGLRKENIVGLNQYFDELLKEYRSLAKNVSEKIRFSDGQLSIVQRNLRDAHNEILIAKGGISQAKTEISSASTSIASAKDDINKAIVKLESAKKGNSFWLPIIAGAGGVFLGILIGKK